MFVFYYCNVIFTSQHILITVFISHKLFLETAIRHLITSFIHFVPAKDGEFPNGQVMSSLRSSSKMSVNYLHSFAMTENYYVYMEQPMFINGLKILLQKLRGVPFADVMEWCPYVKVIIV